MTAPRIEQLTSSDFEVRKRTPKVLFFDIETAPLRIASWKTWQTDAIRIERDWYMLCWSAKWQGGKHITRGLCDYDKYDPFSEDDSLLVDDLWTLLGQADVVVGHNLDKFDIRKTNTRAIIHGKQPLAPYKTIDTLKIARRHFAFSSNRLDALGEFLGLGRKRKTGGYDLWESCMRGDAKAWRNFKLYNKQDVVLLEAVYNRFLPWIDNHPHIGILQQMEAGCRNCGSSDLVKQGIRITATGYRQSYQCKKCGSWMSGNHQKKTDIR